jgi:hypothetical protein
MLSHPPAKRAPRDRLFWMALVALAIGQLVAFWMLCSQQVRKAQIRDVSLAVQRVAVADCLQYVPGATLSSCLNRVDASRRPDSTVIATGSRPKAAPVAAPATLSSGTPVSVSYR